MADHHTTWQAALTAVAELTLSQSSNEVWSFLTKQVCLEALNHLVSPMLHLTKSCLFVPRMEMSVYTRWTVERWKSGTTHASPCSTARPQRLTIPRSASCQLTCGGVHPQVWRCGTMWRTRKSILAQMVAHGTYTHFRTPVSDHQQCPLETLVDLGQALSHAGWLGTLGKAKRGKHTQ